MDVDADTDVQLNLHPNSDPHPHSHYLWQQSCWHTKLRSRQYRCAPEIVMVEMMTAQPSNIGGYGHSRQDRKVDHLKQRMHNQHGFP